MTLLRPSLFPDETALSYQGRLMRLNGISHPDDAVRKMRALADRSEQPDPHECLVERLARIAGMVPTQFVRHHTTLTYQRAFAYRKGQAIHPHGSAATREVMRMTGLRPIRHASYFCAQCTAEDLDFHGVTYWRRAHQMPGTFWCEKHGCPLHFVDTEAALLSPPGAFMAAGVPVEEQWVQRLQESPSINRFLAISADLVDRGTPWDERDVSQLIRQRAATKGLHTGRGRASKPRISELLRDQFEPVWLATVIPALDPSSSDQGSGQTIDRALYGKRQCVATEVYAAILAVLFESADDAMVALVHAAEGATSPAREPKRALPSPDQLRDLYVAAQGDIQSMATTLGLPRDRVRRGLLDFGWPGLGSAAQAPLMVATRAFLIDGDSLAEACQRAGVSAENLEALLRLAATPLRLAIKGMDRGRTQRRPNAMCQAADPPVHVKPNLKPAKRTPADVCAVA